MQDPSYARSFSKEPVCFLFAFGWLATIPSQLRNSSRELDTHRLLCFFFFFFANVEMERGDWDIACACISRERKNSIEVFGVSAFL